MTPIDQNRLLQMRSAILSQNQALQRAAGLDAPQPATDATSFTQTLSDAVRAVDQQQATRALYFTTRAGQPIPEDLYQAVAIILAFVFRLDRELGERTQPPSVDVPATKCFDADGNREAR